jgi:hypothetical protein
MLALERQMNISDLSVNALQMMHRAIWLALHVDDSTAPGEPKPHGVRAHADFRQLNDEIESELDKRGVEFSPLDWEENAP